VGGGRGLTRRVREASVAADAAAAAGPWVCGAGGERQSATARRRGSGGFRAAPEKDGAADMDRGGRCPGGCPTAAAEWRELVTRLDGASWSGICEAGEISDARGGWRSGETLAEAEHSGQPGEP
jgi:hypothetical protein